MFARPISHITGVWFFPALLILPFLAFAIEDDFTVRTLVGGDTNPPTAPTLLTATPVATTQIDLAWASSTDDFFLSGYHVWRDNVQIATTSATSYEDVGLTPSMTYAYYVTAFDSSFNISASSSVVSTTTLRIPSIEPEPEEGTTYGTRIRPLEEEILSLEVVVSADSAIIRFSTHGHVRSVLSWGKTGSYELGSVVERAFRREHSIAVHGLTPGTRYEFSIRGENGIGREGVMHTGSFRTLPSVDTFPPGNVTGLSAVLDGEDIVLSWQNPNDPDFTGVRIVRSDRFYPTHADDGWVAYEGGGEGARDRGAVTGGWQYYTVFAYDESGNESSGAVISLFTGEGEPPEPFVPDPVLNDIELSFEDLIFTQEGDILEKKGQTVTINGSKQLSISIPYERLPEHLKTILVVIKESATSERAVKFLLRVNAEKTHYSGTLAAFGRGGTLPVVVSVLDFKTAQVGYAEGIIVSEVMSAAPGTRESSLWPTVLFVFLLALLAYLTLRLTRREGGAATPQRINIAS